MHVIGLLCWGANHDYCFGGSQSTLLCHDKHDFCSLHCSVVLHLLPKVKANLKGDFDAKRAIRRASTGGSGFVNDESGVQILENSPVLAKLRKENEELRKLVNDLEQQLGTSTEVIGSSENLLEVSIPEPIMECSPESEQSS